MIFGILITRETQMQRKKILKVSSVVMMISSLILIGWDFMEESKYKLENVLSHIGLFLAGAYFFYLYRRKNRSERSEESQWQERSEGQKDQEKSGTALK